jgi:hypothetical protein
MIIGKKFNELNPDEYIFYVNNHKKYTDFNTLGLYRSLTENDKLSLEEKIAIREHAHNLFKKSFDFLQIKDPYIFIEVSNLGIDLTKADRSQAWDDVKVNQQKILKDKRIRHRNFGDYSKHNCQHDDCVYNGLMIRQNSRLAEGCIYFADDKNKAEQKVKSDRRKLDRKQIHLIINKQIDDQ